MSKPVLHAARVGVLPSVLAKSKKMLAVCGHEVWLCEYAALYQHEYDVVCDGCSPAKAVSPPKPESGGC